MVYRMIYHCTECIDCPYGVDISVFVCVKSCSHFPLIAFHPLRPNYLRLDVFETVYRPRLFLFVHFLKREKKNKQVKSNCPPLFVHIVYCGEEIRNQGCLFSSGRQRVSTAPAIRVLMNVQVSVVVNVQALSV